MENTKKWPDLNFTDLQDTLETLHQWIQIVGKIRLRTMPWQNHSWHTALYINTHGFTTQAIPYKGSIFQIDFDFKQHKLIIQSSDAETLSMELRPRTVADFYNELFDKLASIGIDVKIHGSPNEMDPAIPFAENVENKSYDPKAASTIWQAMLKANQVFNYFRSEFYRKVQSCASFLGSL